jgi:hypothetical protein
MLRTMFIDHPESVGESYGEHFMVAMGFGLTMVGAGLACIVHAVVPGAFVRTGSAAVTGLYERMVRHRRKARDSGITAADALEWVI